MSCVGEIVDVVEVHINGRIEIAIIAPSKGMLYFVFMDASDVVYTEADGEITPLRPSDTQRSVLRPAG